MNIERSIRLALASRAIIFLAVLGIASGSQGQVKDSRENRPIQRIHKELPIKSNVAKLKTDNQTTDKSMQESRERADRLQKLKDDGTAVPSNALVDVPRPVVERQKLAGPCRLPGDACSEPCKLPPCQ